MSDAYTRLRYSLLEGGTAIQCHGCNLVSHNRDDVARRYCGRCQRFHDDRALELPAKVKAIADAIAMEARATIGQGREVTPEIYVLNMADELLLQPDMHMGEPEEREIMAQETRLLADQINADVVILLSEAWARKTATTAEMAALRAQHGDSIAAMPDRDDILLLTVETPGHYWQGRAPITGKGPDRRCGDMVYELAATEQGRFTHFLYTASQKAALAKSVAAMRAALAAHDVNPDAQISYDGAMRPLIDIYRRVMVRHGEYEATDAERMQLAAGFLATLLAK